MSHPVHRPEESVLPDVLRLLAAAVLTAIPVVVTRALYWKLSLPEEAFRAVVVCVILVYLYCFGKKLLLTLILLYQKYAPSCIRASCLFTPCCSEYMKQSILKYGVPKGVLRGIRRILRCHPPNGGVDEP